MQGCTDITLLAFPFTTLALLLLHLKLLSLNNKTKGRRFISITDRAALEQLSSTSVELVLRLNLLFCAGVAVELLVLSRTVSISVASIGNMAVLNLALTLVIWSSLKLTKSYLALDLRRQKQ